MKIIDQFLALFYGALLVFIAILAIALYNQSASDKIACSMGMSDSTACMTQTIFNNFTK